MLSVLIPGVHVKSSVAQESPIIQSIDLVTDLLLEFTEENNNTIIEKEFVIPYFRDISYLEFQFDAVYDSLDIIDVVITINNKIMKESLIQTTLDIGTYIVVLDSRAELGIQFPKNVFSLQINTSYINRIFLDTDGYITLQIHKIALHTLYQNDPIPLLSKEGVELRKEAIIIPDGYYSQIKSSFLNIYKNILYFQVVLPREINETYSFNLTLKTNVEVEYRSIFMEYFGIQQQKSGNLSHSVEFQYISKISRPITTLRVEIFPVAGKDFLLEVDGFFKLVENYEVFPVSDFDMILFFMVTAVIPLLFLSKLFYKRLRNFT